MMHLYRLDPPPTHDDDGNEIVWAPRARLECTVPARQAMRLLLDGWWICAPGRDVAAEV
jgi:hypothetical protein